MGRVPFYAYTNSPYSFYGYPAESYYHRPQRQFYPASSSTPRRAPSPVINVPVHDSTPARPSSAPPQPPIAASALVDRSSAATTIQSLFRGYCVRRHQPLLHLRSVNKARKELEDLQAELEKHEVSLKLRTSEKERLRFSENVMAIIFRLDGVEGSIAEVRSQRKEATKMAIKLQDAIDAIMMQKDEIAALDPTVDEDVMLEGNDAVPNEQSQEALHSEADMVNVDQEEGCAVPVNTSMHVNTLQENPLQTGENVADEGVSEIDNGTTMGMGIAEDVASLHPGETEIFSNQMEGGSGDMELVSQIEHAKTACEEEEDSLIMGEASGSDVTHSSTVATLAADEVGNDDDASHVESCGNHMKNDVNDIQMEGVTCVDNMVDASDGFADGETTNGRESRLNVVQERTSKAVDLSLGIATPEENLDCRCDDNTVHANEGQNPLTSLEKLTEDDRSLDGHNCGQGCEERSKEANSINIIDYQTCTPSSSQDNGNLYQLSENCRQLKSLVGRLLVQNKAQSNVLCALAERLEALERKQQRADRHNRQKMREKRKVKKGLKNSVRYENSEDFY